MSKYLHFIFLVALHISCYRSLAQNYPVYNSYYVNPYLYNPAEAATEYTYILVNYRQQWLGVEGAPIVSTINFNTLLKDRHAGVGAKVSSFKRGLLNTTDASLTYAYGINVREKNTFFFGLSGGAITSSIDVNKISDPDDPAVAGYLENNMQATANFGLLYRASSGINLGVSLPQLIAPKYNSLANFESTAFSPFDQVIITAYYNRKIAGKLVAGKKKGVRAKVMSNEKSAPLELYLTYKYAKIGNSQFEALCKLNLSENLWLGGLYRQGYGYGGIIGVNIKRFLLGYSYELGSQPAAGVSTGTHEVQMGLRLGKIKKLYKPKPTLRSTIKKTNEQHIARFQQSVDDTEHVDEEEEDKKKYYVVVKAFSDFNGADQFKKKLIEQKFGANIFYYEKDKKYYVHVLESAKQSEANEEVKALKKLTKIKDARVLMVTNPK